MRRVADSEHGQIAPNPHSLRICRDQDHGLSTVTINAVGVAQSRSDQDFAAWIASAARVALANWKTDYNTVRPHSALGNKPPMALRIAQGNMARPELHGLEIGQRRGPRMGASSNEERTLHSFG